MIKKNHIFCTITYFSVIFLHNRIDLYCVELALANRVLKHNMVQLRNTSRRHSYSMNQKILAVYRIYTDLIRLYSKCLILNTPRPLSCSFFKLTIFCPPGLGPGEGWHDFNAGCMNIVWRQGRTQVFVTGA